MWRFILLALVACTPSSTGTTGAVGSSVDMQTPSPSQNMDTMMQPQVSMQLGGKLLVGLFENPGGKWMKESGVAWNARYAYFVRGWENNFGYGQHDGSFALDYMKSSDAEGRVPAIAYYVMNNYEPQYREDLFYQKTTDTTTMQGYFADFKLMMQRCKDFGKPAMIMMEGDGYAYMEVQSGNDPNAHSAIAETGMAELQGLPNTAAGWGLAFLAIKKAVGADNCKLGMHLSGWASGKDLLYFSTSDALQPEIDKVYAFLAPLGLTENVTGITYDFVVSDPLDRDSDFYVLTRSEDRWWDMSATAAVSSKSFNRYKEYLRLWHELAKKPIVLWQIPLGNAQHLNQENTGQPRGGYKDNRVEYFLGDKARAQAFADVGVIALLFGAGAGGQSSYGNDLGTNNESYIKTLAKAFFDSGGVTTLP